MRTQSDCINRLQAAGISYDDAVTLRRISMTLHRWFELECGDGNDYGSWCITRGRKIRVTRPAASTPYTEFEHDDDGTPFLEHHHYRHGQGKDSVSYTRLPDREAGAKRRLAKIMARYPGFQAYIQGDPRGCALYILHPNAIAGADAFSTDESKRREWLSCNYTRGIAVYK